jgi:hypothetical protein
MPKTSKRRPAGRAPRSPAAVDAKTVKTDGVLDRDLVAMLDDMLTVEDRERILRGAEEQLGALAGKVRLAWTHDDLQAMRQQAHQLAGLAGTAGCVAILAIARAIERASGGSDPALLGRHFKELDEAVPAAIQALRDWRRSARR